MRRTLLGVVAAALLLATPLSAAMRDATFTDPAGDPTGGAPDLTAVSVTNDVGGTIQFHVAVTNFTPESEVVLWLDTDKNLSTGDLGFDYQPGLGRSADPNMTGWWLGQYTAGAWAEAASHSSVVVYSNETYADFRINTSELGGTAGFNFRVDAARFTADAVTGTDPMPDGALQLLTYDLTVPTPTPTPTPAPAPVVVKPVFGTPSMTPKAKAGTKVIFTLPVNRSDNGQPLTTGKMICDPSVLAVVIKHAESFKGGVARLAFTIPKTAKGKTLKVKVTIVNGKQSATKITTYKVR
jgi:hypothetical protein